MKCENGCSDSDAECCDDPCCTDPCSGDCDDPGAKCQANCDDADPECCDDPCCEDPCSSECEDTEAKCDAGCDLPDFESQCCPYPTCSLSLSPNGATGCDGDVLDFDVFLTNTTPIPDSPERAGMCDVPTTFDWTATLDNLNDFGFVGGASGGVSLNPQTSAFPPPTVSVLVQPNASQGGSLLVEAINQDSESSCSDQASLGVGTESCSVSFAPTALSLCPGAGQAIFVHLQNMGSCSRDFEWQVGWVPGSQAIMQVTPMSGIVTLGAGASTLISVNVASFDYAPFEGTTAVHDVRVRAVGDVGWMCSSQITFYIPIAEINIDGIADEDEEIVGRYIGVNVDDDDDNDVLDKNQAGAVLGEDDLVAIEVSLKGVLDTITFPNPQISVTVTEGASRIKLYRTADRSQPYDGQPFAIPGDTPATLYVEGIAPSVTERDVEITATIVGGFMCEDIVKFTVVQPDLRPFAKTEDEGRFEGTYLSLNDDDDDSNDVPDYAQGGVLGEEDDLVPITVTLSEAALVAGTLSLEAAAGGGNIRIWESPDKQTEVILPKIYVPGDEPDTLWVEGVTESAGQRDTALHLVFTPPQGSPIIDVEEFTVFKVEVLDIQGFNPTMAGGIASPLITLAGLNGFERVGALADGMSVLMLRLRTQNQFVIDMPLTLEVRHQSQNGEPQNADIVGSLHDMLPALPAPDPHVGSTGNTTLDLAAMENHIAMYRPPNNFLFGQSRAEISMELTARLNDGQFNPPLFTRKLRLVRAPIILGHGLFGNGPNMQPMKSALLAASPQADVDIMSYAGSNTSGYDTNAHGIPIRISALVNAWRDQEIAATRCDYVGHSMGACLVKWYVSDIAIPPNSPASVRIPGGGWPNIAWSGTRPFKRADNFGRGDLRRVITIGGPLRGSPMGNEVTWSLLVGGDYANLQTLFPVFAVIRPGATGNWVALHDLAKGTVLTTLMAGAHPDVSWVPIITTKGTIPATSQWNQFLQAVGINPTQDYLDTIGLGVSESDGVVELKSQAYSLTDPINNPQHKIRFLANILHTNQPNDARVHRVVRELLDIRHDDGTFDPAYDQFNDQFPP
ncbi:MAG: hypothetical protein GXP29_02610 [Planctomycetes bacterium]|nr:hypothetical protein [Planctomycetota bacterium]